jgi:hypothetical protein
MTLAERRKITTAARDERRRAARSSARRNKQSIDAKQSRLIELGEAQVQLQSAMLNVQQQQLAVQQQTAISAEISATQLQIQTQMQEKVALDRERQKQLKQTAFSLRQKLTSGEVTNHPDLVARAWMLATLVVDVSRVGLLPNEMEELADKEYAQTVISTLESGIRDTTAQLSSPEREDLAFAFAYAGTLADHARSLEQARAGAMSWGAARAQLESRIGAFDAQLATIKTDIDARSRLMNRLYQVGGVVAALGVVGVVVSTLIGSSVEKNVPKGDLGTWGALMVVFLFLVTPLGLGIAGIGYMAGDPVRRKAYLSRQRAGLAEQLSHSAAQEGGANQQAWHGFNSMEALKTQIAVFCGRHPDLATIF